MKKIYSDKGALGRLDINASDLAITSGCNLAFVAVIMALADAGDEVILPVPWYFNHQYVSMIAILRINSSSV